MVRSQAHAEAPTEIVARSSNLTPQETNEIVNNSWFSSLPAVVRHDLLRYSSLVRFVDGDAIASEGDPVLSIFALAGGVARVGATTRQAGGSVRSFILPGTWFGFASLFDGLPRDHSIYARGNCAVLRLGRNAIEKIGKENGCLYHALAVLQSKQTRQLFEEIDDLKTASLRIRAAKKLLRLTSDDLDGPSNARIFFTQTELANLIGSGRQRLNHELKEFERLGLVRVESKSLTILDAAALQRIVESD